MFELSVACKYLIPRWRQLSVSIISLISVFVISLVVWLIIVFFSVTEGLEKNWVQKLTALTAPVRVMPTEAYFRSYYYLIDNLSEASNYSLKTINEKKSSLLSDPYNPEIDEEIPSSWPLPDSNSDGSLKDLVKLPFHFLSEIKGVSGLKANDYELTATEISLDLIRSPQLGLGQENNKYSTHSSLNYPVYLGNFDPDNLQLSHTFASISQADLNNLLRLTEVSSFHQRELPNLSDSETFQKKLTHFLSLNRITAFKTKPTGWTISPSILPPQFEWKGAILLKQGRPVQAYIPAKETDLSMIQKELREAGFTTISGTITKNNKQLSLSFQDHGSKEVSERFPLILFGSINIPAKIDEKSVENARKLNQLYFSIEAIIQGTRLKGIVPYDGFEIAQSEKKIATTTSPLWVHKENNGLVLPSEKEFGEGILLPKSFREGGVLVGDRGTLSYVAATSSLIQEQKIPVYVAGFYDPGIIPIGGKFVLANREVTSLIRSSHQQEDRSSVTNGINVRFDNLNQADLVKSELQKKLNENGIDRYWTIQTYRDYEFTKEIMQELRSQKNLFMLIALVIIIVACSNIISMLIILVNDKKLEIGILRSMGASSTSIALIFGISGAFIGISGSLLGIGSALITLKNLNLLTDLLSRLQGHEMFSSSLYGEVLPSELSWEALSYVLLATVLLSLLAGIIPAIKACLVRPSEILKGMGG